jgi:DNA-binding transcriptional MerR regulator
MAEGYKTFQQVATELNVSTNTLRRWTKEFAQFISSSPVGGDGASRRFAEEDIVVLQRIKDQLSAGLSTDELLEDLHDQGHGETASAMALAPHEGGQATGFVVLTDTLRAMIENQQTIQNSLQVNRNLQGVIIQDNFNLKEENIKLRDQMRQLEQELSELRQRDSDYRLALEQRLARLEAEARKGVLGKLF